MDFKYFHHDHTLLTRRRKDFLTYHLFIYLVFFPYFLMGQGRGWSHIETLNSCKAYTAASEDPRRGSGKKKEVFAKKAQVVYDLLRAKAKKKLEEELNCRTSDAIWQRYRKDKCECLKLDGIIQSLLARNPSASPTESDI